jgi:hypothetical protein
MGERFSSASERCMVSVAADCGATAETIAVPA